MLNAAYHIITGEIVCTEQLHWFISHHPLARFGLNLQAMGMGFLIAFLAQLFESDTNWLWVEVIPVWQLSSVLFVERKNDDVWTVFLFLMGHGINRGEYRKSLTLSWQSRVCPLWTRSWAQPCQGNKVACWQSPWKQVGWLILTG